MTLGPLTRALLLALLTPLFALRAGASDLHASRTGAPICAPERARGCGSIWDRFQAFDRVQAELATNDVDIPTGAPRVRKADAELFSALQKRGNIGKLPSVEVSRLFDAAYAAQYNTGDPAYLQDMLLDLHALEQSGGAAQTTATA